MTKKYNILGKYIKDLSSETKDTETYLFVKEYISIAGTKIIVKKIGFICP